jgi:hypothetical protein
MMEGMKGGNEMGFQLFGMLGFPKRENPLEKKQEEKDLRAKELFQKGYFVLKWDGDTAVCSSLAPDDSIEIGHLHEYRFPLKED